MSRPATCPYCHAPLVQPSLGRPRQFCPDAVCQRRADADRRRARRRRAAGIPDYGQMYVPSARQHLERQRGGRYPLIRRIAWDIATAKYPNVTPAEHELVALEAAVRAGVLTRGSRLSDLGSLIRGQPHWATNMTLAADERRVLRRLERRNRDGGPSPATPPRARKAVDRTPSPQLPEPFSRPRRARGASRRDNDMAWLDLPLPPPKPRIELPLPAERELIDLPTPKRERRP